MRTRLAFVLLAMALPLSAASAQSIRDAIAGAGLGSGYAQMLNLASTPDLSSAYYDVKDNEPQTKIDLTRIPYDAKWMSLSPSTDLRWRVAGSYFQMKGVATLTSDAGTGSVDTKWTAWSGSGGLYTSTDLGSGFSVEPGLDVGLAHLDNSASYNGAANELKPVLDGLLFNWNMDAWLVTPSVALEWKDVTPERRMRVRAHAAWSWISSFDESDRVLGFNEEAGTYSIRGEYAAPTGWHVMDHSLDYVGFLGYSGFFGGNRDALGFTSVSEVGGGIETPLIKDQRLGQQVRFSGSYLFGPNVRGWTVSLGLEF